MNRQLAKTFPADNYASEAAAKRSAQRDRLRGDSVTLSEAAARTGASKQRLTRLARQGVAVTFLVEGETRFPTWQLRSNELTPVPPEIHHLVELFAGDLPGLNAWIHSPNDDLGGMRPADALGDDEFTRVLGLARAIGAAGA